MNTFINYIKNGKTTRATSIIETSLKSKVLETITEERKRVAAVVFGEPLEESSIVEDDGHKEFHIGTRSGGQIFKTRAKDKAEAMKKITGTHGGSESYYKHINKPTPSQQLLAQRT